MNISRLDGLEQGSSLSVVSGKMDLLQKQPLQYSPWKTYPCKPDVGFTIAYGKDCIFLKYFVAEKQIRSVHSITNSNVYEDSCVEFFISFDNDQAYYNFEFNCLGTCLAAFGTGRANRLFLPVEIISRIKTRAIINKEQDGLINWELLLVIPLVVFCKHSIDALGGMAARANFYKCGDLLPEPHYITWADIDAPAPDFHLPGFFKTISFL